ncbi:MAG TPA: hypothetical protein VM934_02330 [Pyrinomonadaceae bacterium]|jgi:hypothetical protein|nr:hypothetical protein [Pyrinomonadaceae bacterium]
METPPSKISNWLVSLLSTILILRVNPNTRRAFQHESVENNPTLEETARYRQLEVQINLAEYDALMREHELLQKMRQELGIYTIAGTVALFGAFLSQITVFKTPEFLRLFLVMPFFFTLMSWWYIRTNYSAAAIELYIATKLRVRLSHLADAQVMEWVKFLYAVELSPMGKVVLGLQTISRLGLIQGPAILSLLIFCFKTDWEWKKWSALDCILIFSNILAIVMSFMLMIMTRALIMKIRHEQ